MNVTTKEMERIARSASFAFSRSRRLLEPWQADELRQECRIAIWRAQDKFQSDRGATFETFARWECWFAMMHWNTKRRSIVTRGHRGSLAPDTHEFTEHACDGGISQAEAELDLTKIATRAAAAKPTRSVNGLKASLMVLSGHYRGSEAGRALGISRQRVDQQMKVFVPALQKAAS